MNDKEKIEELENQIKFLKSQVSALKLTVKQAEFANGFLDEIYPIVEKYAMIALNDKDNLQGDKAE
nr:MAG TPA: protein of unknown function (DUF5320) [Caudoviricetes sp.]